MSLCVRTAVTTHVPVCMDPGTAWVAEAPCCQLKASWSILLPGVRNLMSKYVCAERPLPEKVAAKAPPSEILVRSNARLLTSGPEPSTQVLSTVMAPFAPVNAPGLPDTYEPL